MIAKEVESILTQAGIPHYWDFITTYDGTIKVYYFDYDTGEEDYDTFRIEGSEIYRRLYYMPFDRNGMHATGWELWNQTTSGGFWTNEYEEE